MKSKTRTPRPAEGMTVTTISLMLELHEEIKLTAHQEGRSTNRQIQLMLAAALVAHKAGIDLTDGSWADRHPALAFKCEK